MSKLNITNKWKHFKTVCRHKAVVYRECKACGIWWQGIVHDLSKFSRIEFAPSARYFQGDKSPIEAQKAKEGYSIAWLNHKSHNKHHWEWWTDFDKNGAIIANRIPKKYVVEMLCDWIGAGKVYSKEKWTQEEPLNYFNKVKDGRHFHKDTEEVINRFLEIIRDLGLEDFHKVAKQWIRIENDFYTFW